MRLPLWSQPPITRSCQYTSLFIIISHRTRKPGCHEQRTVAESHVMMLITRHITSVVASTDAPYFSRSSTIFIRFFLQAMCNGVKPFYNNLTMIFKNVWVKSYEAKTLKKGDCDNQWHWENIDFFLKDSEDTTVLEKTGFHYALYFG